MLMARCNDDDDDDYEELSLEATAVYKLSLLVT